MTTTCWLLFWGWPTGARRWLAAAVGGERGGVVVAVAVQGRGRQTGSSCCWGRAGCAAGELGWQSCPRPLAAPAGWRRARPAAPAPLVAIPGSIGIEHSPNPAAAASLLRPACSPSATRASDLPDPAPARSSTTSTTSAVSAGPPSRHLRSLPPRPPPSALHHFAPPAPSPSPPQ